jgi:hypothetical protein
MLEAFRVPERDRYQLVHEHKPGTMIVEDTGLDIPRTEKAVIVSVTSRPARENRKRTSTGCSARSSGALAASRRRT